MEVLRIKKVEWVVNEKPKPPSNGFRFHVPFKKKLEITPTLPRKFEPNGEVYKNKDGVLEVYKNMDGGLVNRVGTNGERNEVGIQSEEDSDTESGKVFALKTKCFV